MRLFRTSTRQRQSKLWKHRIRIAPNEGKRSRRATQRLKRAYVEARYSLHYEITEEELNWLSAEVEKLQQLTEQSCQQKLSELGKG